MHYDNCQAGFKEARGKYARLARILWTGFGADGMGVVIEYIFTIPVRPKITRAKRTELYNRAET